MDVESLPDVVGSGDYRRSLTALRDHLALACAEAEVRELAPLARQLALVLKELDELKEPGVSVVSNIRARSDARRLAAAPDSDSA